MLGGYDHERDICYDHGNESLLWSLAVYGGKKLKCIKEPDNPFDSEAIKVVVKGIGKVVYITNATYTKETGTLGAGRDRRLCEKEVLGGGYVYHKFESDLQGCGWI